MRVMVEVVEEGVGDLVPLGDERLGEALDGSHSLRG